MSDTEPRTYGFDDRRIGDAFVAKILDQYQVHIMSKIESGEPYPDADPSEYREYEAPCGAGSQSWGLGVPGGYEAAWFAPLDKISKYSGAVVCRECFPDHVHPTQEQLTE